MNGNGQLVERLAESEVYKTYEEAFIDATGLPLAMRSVETWKLPLHGKRKENGFCAIMAETSKTCAGCLQMQECLAKSAMNDPAMVTCRYGLCEAAAPIKLGNQTIGFLQTGQVLDRQPTEAGFEKVVSKARDLGVELDKERARGAWFSTPVMPRKKVNSTMTMLWIFAQYLATKSNEIAMREAHAEPPAITRAKKYIEENYGEDLSLGSVSKAVNMSLFYFCKLFRLESWLDKGGPEARGLMMLQERSRPRDDATCRPGLRELAADRNVELFKNSAGLLPRGVPTEPKSPLSKSQSFIDWILTETVPARLQTG